MIDIRHLCDEFNSTKFGWLFTNELDFSNFPLEINDNLRYDDRFQSEVKLCRQITEGPFDSYYFWFDTKQFDRRVILLWDNNYYKTQSQQLSHFEAVQSCPFKNKTQTKSFKWNRVLPLSVKGYCEIETTINYVKFSHFIVNIDKINTIQYIIVFNFDNYIRQTNTINCEVVIYYINSFKEILVS